MLGGNFLETVHDLGPDHVFAQGFPNRCHSFLPLFLLCRGQFMDLGSGLSDKINRCIIFFRF